ncbi:MAG: hypothetical protein ACLGIN_00050, partial [Candidatus Sericytochromatia bacterium]
MKRFGLERTGDAHRALADAEGAAGVFMKALQHLSEGTQPAPTGIVKVEAPIDLTGDPWEAVVRYVKRSSMVTAAILGQYGQSVRQDEDGLTVALTPEHLPFVENERARVEEAVRLVYGEGTALRLEPR